MALTIAGIGQLVGTVILGFYLSRLLQVEGLGIYATVMAVFQMVSIGCGIGLNSFIPCELPKDLSQTNRYLIHSGLVAVGSAVVLGLGLDLLVPHLGYLPETQTGLYIMSLSFIPTALLVVMNAVFIVYQKSEFITASTVASVVGRIVVSLLALHFGAGVVGLFVVYTAFSYLVLLVTAWFLARHVVVPHWDFSWPFMRAMLRSLRVFAALALLSTVFSQAEVVILSLLQGEAQVGLYAAALKLITIWYMLPTSYMTVVFPMLSAAYHESRPRAVAIQNRSFKYLFAIAFPLAVGLALAADALVQLYGAGFEESARALRLLAWSVPLVYCNMVLWRILLARGERRVVLRGQFIADSFRVLLALLLTPRLGYMGAAWALMGGTVVYTLYHSYFVRRDKTPLSLVRLGWRFALAALMMGALVWMLAPGAQLGVLVPLSAAVYAALVVALRAFTPEDWNLLRQLLKPHRAGEQVRNEVTLTDQRVL